MIQGFKTEIATIYQFKSRYLTGLSPFGFILIYRAISIIIFWFWIGVFMISLCEEIYEYYCCFLGRAFLSVLSANKASFTPF